MTPSELYADLSARGVVVTHRGDSLEIDAPENAVTDEDVALLREHKPRLLRLLRLADGLPADEESARLLECEEVDPDTVPVCESCGRYCDVQTLADQWRCSRCDPEAKSRRERTRRLLEHAERIRGYT